jgi:hypothetical protein
MSGQANDNNGLPKHHRPGWSHEDDFVAGMFALPLKTPVIWMDREDKSGECLYLRKIDALITSFERVTGHTEKGFKQWVARYKESVVIGGPDRPDYYRFKNVRADGKKVWASRDVWRESVQDIVQQREQIVYNRLTENLNLTSEDFDRFWGPDFEPERRSWQESFEPPKRSEWFLSVRELVTKLAYRLQVQPEWMWKRFAMPLPKLPPAIPSRQLLPPPSDKDKGKGKKPLTRR